MPASGFRGPKALVKAGQWSMQGLKAAYQNEASFRLEVYLFIILIPLAIWLAESSTQLLMLLGSAWLVLLVEILNSAIEAVVDLICGDEQHELAGRAKDMGSAAVFLATALTLVTWAMVIYQNYLI